MWGTLLGLLMKGFTAGMQALGVGEAGAAAGGAAKGFGRFMPFSFSPTTGGVQGNPDFAGLLARLSLGGGNLGSAARIGLAGYVKAIGQDLPEGTAGFLARDFADLGKSVTGLPGKIRSWGEELTNSQSQMSTFSGVIAQAMGQLEIERTRREIKTAQETATATKFGAESLSYREEADRKWESLGTRIGEYIAGALNYGMGALENGLYQGLIGLPWELGQKLREAAGLPTEGSVDKQIKDAQDEKRRDEQNWLNRSTPEKRKAWEETKRREAKRSELPDQWWTGQIPQHDAVLNQMMVDISHGLYHSRQYPPLPPIDGVPREPARRNGALPSSRRNASGK